jgi:hypothetical protein
MTRKRKSIPRLTVEQGEIVASFAAHARDNRELSFQQVAKKVLPEGFGKGARGQRFRKEAKEVFDRERKPKGWVRTASDRGRLHLD